MYKDLLSRKLIDVMGNQSLSTQQRCALMLEALHDVGDPEEFSRGVQVILETYGLAPRHETPVQAPSFDEESVARIEKLNRERVDHELKGWFEINRDRPFDKTLIEICCFLEEIPASVDRAIVFGMILSSPHVPIVKNYFSRFTREQSDDLLVREYASEYIQMRQLLNVQLDPTSRGSLVLEFLQSLDDKPKAILLGAFVEELMRRLRNKPKVTSSQPFSASFPFQANMDPQQAEEMMKNFQSMLPPEVLDRLRKLFGQDPENPNLP